MCIIGEIKSKTEKAIVHPDTHSTSTCSVHLEHRDVFKDLPPLSISIKKSKRFFESDMLLKRFYVSYIQPNLSWISKAINIKYIWKLECYLLRHAFIQDAIVIKIYYLYVFPYATKTFIIKQ